ncbi:MAG: SH3 domain-containing protein [Clostridia bacterium]|nr:SH3 domain-containing protein [Clostridia bacterium]
MKKRITALLIVLVLLTAAGAAAAATYYHVNTSWLKLRDQPSSSGGVLDSYREDFAATIVQKVNGTWSKVKFTNGKQGYVMTTYLSPTSRTYSAWVTANKTYMRSGPSTTFSALYTLNRGSKVTVLSHGRSFDYVRSGSAYGYVRNNYLSTNSVKSDGSPTAAAPVAARGSRTLSGTVYVTCPNKGSVNVHRGPGMGYSNAYRVRYGYAVQVQEKVDNSWYKITYGGQTGYILGEYLTSSRPADAPEETASSASEEEAAPAPSVSYPFTGTITCPAGEKVNVRSGPGTGYTHLARLDPGTEVTVLGLSSGWYHVSINGTNGYVMKKFITR